VQTFNVFNGADWDSENDREGYRHKVIAFGRRLGADLIGGSLYEVPPGEKTSPRSPDGEQVLEPGDVAVFPEGPAGAHQVRNDTEESVRLIFFSSKSPLAVVHYPDSKKVGIWTAGDGYQGLVRSEPKLDYWEGEG
jgi:uncharacterized cupin superfamily protein